LQWHRLCHPRLHPHHPTQSLENEIKEKQRLKLKKEKKVIFLFAITSLQVAFPGVILFFLSPSLLHHVVLEEIGEMAGALSYIRRLPPF
jgi:hypothetical protein